LREKLEEIREMEKSNGRSENSRTKGMLKIALPKA
jgi:hypothetical protein